MKGCTDFCAPQAFQKDQQQDCANLGLGDGEPTGDALLPLPANLTVEELAQTFAAKRKSRLLEVLAS